MYYGGIDILEYIKSAIYYCMYRVLASFIWGSLESREKSHDYELTANPNAVSRWIIQASLVSSLAHKARRNAALHHLSFNQRLILEEV